MQGRRSRPTYAVTRTLARPSAEFMHQPWRHRASLDANAEVIPRMSAHNSGDLFRHRGALPRQSLRPALSTMQMAVIFCETSKPTKWDIMIKPPMVRITGPRHPDRDTIERSDAHRDYRMSTYAPRFGRT